MDFNAPKQPNKKSNISFIQSTNKYSENSKYRQKTESYKNSNDPSTLKKIRSDVNFAK